MLIWLIKIGEPVPLDPNVRWLRTAMLAKVLAKRGHHVVWWTSTFDHFKRKHLFKDNDSFSIEKNIQVRTIKGMAYKNPVSILRYLDHLLVSKKFRKYANKAAKPDLIVTAMPDYHLASEAVNYAVEKNVPIVVDIRDKWPDIIWETMPRWLAPVAKFALTFDRLKMARALQRVDGICSVSQTWLTWALACAKRKPHSKDRVFYLGSEPHEPVKDTQNNVFFKQLEERAAGRIIVSYIGSFSRMHTPKIMVDVARLMKGGELEKQVFFVVAGDGPLKQDMMSQSMGLENMFFPGWLTSTDIRVLLDKSTLGIVSSGFDVDMFPNKAFTFLSAGVPVLTSHNGDLPNLLQRFDAGAFYRYDSPPALLDLIVRSSNKQRHEQLSVNAHRLFSELCKADNIYNSFAQYVESAFSDGKRPVEDLLATPSPINNVKGVSK